MNILNKSVCKLDFLLNNRKEGKKLLKSIHGCVLYGIKQISTDRYYIGITKGICNRMYSTKFGHIKRYLDRVDKLLYNVLNSAGLSDFELIIFILSDTILDVSDLESEYILKYDSYNNGFNLTPNGKAHGVASHTTPAGIKDGYISITRNGINTWIHKDYLDEYVDNGWIKGRTGSPNKDLVVVSNPSINKYKYIKEYEVDKFLIDNPGYIRGRFINTKRVYEKGPMTKMISPNGEIKKIRNISKWESKGWKLYEPLKP